MVPCFFYSSASLACLGIPVLGLLGEINGFCHCAVLVSVTTLFLHRACFLLFLQSARNKLLALCSEETPAMTSYNAACILRK